MAWNNDDPAIPTAYVFGIITFIILCIAAVKIVALNIFASFRPQGLFGLTWGKNQNINFLYAASALYVGLWMMTIPIWPLYSQSFLYSDAATVANNHTATTCTTTVRTAWSFNYCVQGDDNCALSSCDNFPWDWRTNENRNLVQLFDVTYGLFIVALWGSLWTVIAAFAHLLFGVFNKSKKVTGGFVAILKHVYNVNTLVSLVCFGIAIVVFPAHWTAAARNDSCNFPTISGSDSLGPCRSFIGEHSFMDGHVRVSASWGGFGYWIAFVLFFLNSFLAVYHFVFRLPGGLKAPAEAATTEEEMGETGDQQEEAGEEGGEAEEEGEPAEEEEQSNE